MKHSGIKRIGKIPDNWEVIRVKDAFFRKKGKAHQEDPVILSLARSGIKIRDISTNEGQLAENYNDYNPVSIDDLLLNPMDLVSGDNCNISKVEGVISPAYVNLRHKKGINPIYYNYYFKYQYRSMAFFSYGKGVSFDNRWTLNNDTLEKFPIILPSFEEQNKIAKFLDKKTSKIDSLYADIEKQIEKLEEYKLSVITEAVTRGLNPNVEMKDSGINLIGNIPSNYTTIRLKHVCKKITDGSHFSPITTEEGRKYITATNINHDSVDVENAKNISEYDFKILVRNGCQPKKEDVLLTKDGSVGRTAVVNNTDYVVLSSVGILTPNKNRVLSYFLKYAIDSKNVQEQMFQSMAGSALKRITISKINEYYIVLPNLKEQTEILSFLDIKCKEIDIILNKKQEQLDILDQYKKSLIYEYVTGKKEVPSNY